MVTSLLPESCDVVQFGDDGVNFSMTYDVIDLDVNIDISKSPLLDSVLFQLLFYFKQKISDFHALVSNILSQCNQTKPI